ncbi:hypothetical protein BH10PSE9_BH10PSE9_18060 [soil metagenome]
MPDGGSNFSKHAVKVVVHITIPEAQNDKAGCFNRARTTGVSALHVEMLAPIQFDDHFRFKRPKIRDIAFDGHLPAKFDAKQLPIA